MVLAALLGIAAAGCGSPTKTPSTTTSALPEPDYARTPAETMMKAIIADNLEEYVKYGDAQFKAAVTQEILDTVAGPMKTKYGDFESLTYLSTETQDSYVIVHYKAKFAKGEIGLRMVFDQDHLVAGQFFE
jgi:hypothetical protein